MTLVVDSSVVVAALAGDHAERLWAGSVLGDGALAAPHLMPVEVAHVLRKGTLTGELSGEVASLAHQELLDLRVELFPYSPCGSRAWKLRDNLTAYDAWFVALAELLECELATLDLRLAQSSGTRCTFLTPPAR